MLTLYYAPNACSRASHISLAKSGLAYEARRVNLAQGEQRTPEYLKLNPNGKVPTLVGTTWSRNLPASVPLISNSPM